MTGTSPRTRAPPTPVSSPRSKSKGRSAATRETICQLTELVLRAPEHVSGREREPLKSIPEVLERASHAARPDSASQSETTVGHQRHHNLMEIQILQLCPAASETPQGLESSTRLVTSLPGDSKKNVWPGNPGGSVLLCDFLSATY